MSTATANWVPNPNRKTNPNHKMKHQSHSETTTELALQPVQAMPVAVSKPAPDVASMLHAVIEKGITSDNVGALEKLVGLYERMEDKKAEREFAEAFVRLQTDLPTIEGFRPIPDRQGNVKFRYANFDDIDSIVRPICLRHGFSYAFRETQNEAGRVTVTMTLQHSGGHSREIPYSVRVGSGPPGATDSQADVSGHTYAQRGALESGLALRVVGAKDADPRMEGGPITAEQAFELERRVKETNSDVAAFLKFAGAATFKEIHSGKYATLDNFLQRKERQGK